MEAQVSLTVAFSSSAFFGLLFLIFLLTIPHRFSMEFRSGEFTGQSSTPTSWSFNQLLVLLAVWAGAKSCWKMKSASLKGPLFPNEIQNLLSSEKRTLDHWATVQFFFSLAQVRQLRRVKEFGYSCRQCVVALDALTPASVHSL